MTGSKNLEKVLYNQKTRDREIRGITEAMNIYDLKERLIFTYDRNDILLK